MNRAEKEARELFQDLTRDQFIQLLQESGFEVQDGTGQVIYSENHAEKHFSISVPYSGKRQEIAAVSSDINTYPLSLAC